MVVVSGVVALHLHLSVDLRLEPDLVGCPPVLPSGVHGHLVQLLLRPVEESLHPSGKSKENQSVITEVLQRIAAIHAAVVDGKP